MLDKIKKRCSELDVISILSFVGSVIIRIMRRYYWLGLDKSCQAILMGIGFIMLLISIFRVVFLRKQRWRDVSRLYRIFERSIVRFSFYSMFIFYSSYFIAFIVYIGLLDPSKVNASELSGGVSSLIILFGILNLEFDILTFLLKGIFPWMPFLSISLGILLIYLGVLLTNYEIASLVLVVFAKQFVDVVFSEDFFSNILFLRKSDRIPRDRIPRNRLHRKRLIRIKYKLYSFIYSFVLVHIIRLVLPRPIKSVVRYLITDNQNNIDKVALGLCMLTATIIIFTILDIFVSDIIGDLRYSIIGHYLELFREQDPENRRKKYPFAIGILIFGLSAIINLAYYPKLKQLFLELKELIIEDFPALRCLQDWQIWLGYWLIFALTLLLLGIIGYSLVKKYKKAKTKLRHYLISGTFSDNQEQNHS